MKLKITVHGVAYEVEVEVLDPGEGFAPAGPLPTRAPAARPARPTSAPAAAPAAAAPAPAAAHSTNNQGVVNSPIAGTVVEVRCRPNDKVTKGQVLLVIDAMKMNTSIASPAEGTVRKILVEAGDTVRESQTLVELD